MANRKSKKTRRGGRVQSGPPAQRQAPRPVEEDGESAEVATNPVAASPAPTTRASSLTSGISAPRRAAATSVGIDIDARVPYFTKDLQRIAMTAVPLIILIIAASFILR
jgi:hypothetical protein